MAHQICDLMHGYASFRQARAECVPKIMKPETYDLGGTQRVAEALLSSESRRSEKKQLVPTAAGGESAMNDTPRILDAFSLMLVLTDGS